MSLKQISAFAIILLLTAAPVHAAKAFNQFQAAEQIADSIVEVIGDTKEVFVREFRGVGESHVGLSQLIGTALTDKHKVSIERGSVTEIEGRLFRFPTDDSKPLEGYTIRVTVLTATGERKFSLDVENQEEAEEKVEPPGEFTAPPNDPKGSDPEPGIALDGTIIRPSANSPYGVEVVVEKGSDYVALQPELKKGRVSVNVRKGDIVALRLHNMSGFEAATSVLVDGLSRYALAEDPQRRGGLDLVGNGTPRTIKGYFCDGENVDSFQIGSYSKSVAAKHLPDASSAGTFTIAFRAAWEKGQDPPPNEPVVTKAPPGVVQGPKRHDPTVEVEREIGGLRAVVKIFYGM